MMFLVLAEVGGDDGGPGRHERVGDRTAHASRTAGDQRHLTFEARGPAQMLRHVIRLLDRK
jgi:hypothetical protein